MQQAADVSYRKLYAHIRLLAKTVKFCAGLGIVFAFLGLAESAGLVNFGDIKSHTTPFTGFLLILMCVKLMNFRWDKRPQPWKILVATTLIVICTLSALSSVVPGFPVPVQDILSPRPDSIFRGKFGFESAVFAIGILIAGIFRRSSHIFGEVGLTVAFGIVAFNYIQLLYGVAVFGRDTSVFTLFAATLVLLGVLAIYTTRRFFRVLSLNSWIGATARVVSCGLTGFVLLVGTIFAQFGHVPDEVMNAVAFVSTIWLVLATVAVVYLSNMHEAADRLRRQAERRLLIQAHTDALTGLKNRLGAQGPLEWVWKNFHAKGARYGVILVDLDHFKKLNDTFGHAAGDLALKCVGGVLAGTTRSNDIVARWGGEEFLIVMQLKAGASVRDVAERIRERIEQSEWYAHLPLIPVRKDAGPVTASIGATELLASDPSLEFAIRRADEVLYTAKAAGRNCVMEARAAA